MNFSFFKTNNSLLILLKIFFSLFVFYLFIYCYNLYYGNKLSYFFFSLVFNLYLLFSFREKASFFDIFFCVLLWFGFWFKFTATIIFFNGIFREVGANVSYNTKIYDESLVVSSFSIILLMLASFIMEKILYNKKFTFKSRTEINFFFYKKYKWFIIISLLFISALVSYINFEFRIYQKGLLPSVNVNYIFSMVIRWLLLFGFASFSTIVVLFHIQIYKKIPLYLFILIIIPIFFSSLSLLSRDMIFNSSAILFGIFKMNKIFNFKINIKNFFFYFLSMIILFYLSFALVNYLRSNFFYIGKSIIYFESKTVTETAEVFNEQNKKFNTIDSVHNEFYSIIVHRWVGINSVINLLSNKNKLNFNFLKKSFDEKAIEHTFVDQKTFYEENFDFYNKSSKGLTENVKGNTLPGIFGFLLYSGSFTFLYFCLFIITLICIIIEKLSYVLTKNYIFSALVGMILAYRLAHFGYAPLNSYLIILAIFFNSILFFFIYKFLSKNNKS